METFKNHKIKPSPLSDFLIRIIEGSKNVGIEFFGVPLKAVDVQKTLSLSVGVVLHAYLVNQQDEDVFATLNSRLLMLILSLF